MKFTNYHFAPCCLRYGAARFPDYEAILYTMMGFGYLMSAMRRYVPIVPLKSSRRIRLNKTRRPYKVSGVVV